MKLFAHLLFRLLIATAFVVILPSCANVTRTTPVPGSVIYCFRQMPSDEFRGALKLSDVSYGPYKRHTIGNGSICDLSRFYVYSATWETKNGHKESLTLDLEQVMRKFQDETPGIHALTRHTSQPQVVIDYQLDAVRVFYRVSQYPEGGMNEKGQLVKPAVVTTFPLVTRPLSSQTPGAK